MRDKYTVEPLQVEEDDEIIVPANRQPLLEKLSIIFGEYLGTLLLVLVTCMGCTAGMQGELSSLHTSLNAGLAVMAAIHIFGHVSGAHVNPAVTFAAFIMGEITLTRVPIYIGAQLAGSVTGYAILVALTPKAELNLGVGHGNCVTYPHENLSGVQAMCVEMVLTMVLVLSICATWDRKNFNKLDSVALRIGLVVAMLGFAAGSYTGASMNPARSFGPALFNFNFDSHLVYWVGPTFGAIISSFFYKKIFLRST